MKVQNWGGYFFFWSRGWPQISKAFRSLIFLVGEDERQSKTVLTLMEMPQFIFVSRYRVVKLIQMLNEHLHTAQPLLNPLVPHQLHVLRHL